MSALCLSGGGAITMYHGGHILGLIEAGLYDAVRVVSGTSGGAIMAAMFGCKTRAELLRDVLVNTVSTDYGGTGEQRRRDLPFFPPLWRQLLRFARERVLVDRVAFKRTCDFYWGTTTFQEAYEHTGKVLCIAVQAQRAPGKGEGQRLLMNYVTTPHVTLSSAVAASCALPGIQRPQRLEAKDATGKIVPFEVDGVSWIDGSIQADVPFKRMATLFNVSNFIVAQVNFHVKFVVDDSARRARDPAPGSASGLYRRLVGAAELNVRMRATMLSQLGLMPTLYGNSVRKVFSQKYHGDVTISPRFTYAQSIGLAAIRNPTVADMDGYLLNGKRAVWPHVGRLGRMLALEVVLAECWDLVRLERRRSFADLGILAPRDADESGEDAVAPRRPGSVSFAVNPARADDSTAYRQMEWNYQKLILRHERLRSENLDLRKRLTSIREMCGLPDTRAPSNPLAADPASDSGSEAPATPRGRRPPRYPRSA